MNGGQWSCAIYNRHMQQLNYYGQDKYVSEIEAWCWKKLEDLGMVKRKQKKGAIVVEEKVVVKETVNIENDPLTSSDDEKVEITNTVTVQETIPVTQTVYEEVKAPSNASAGGGLNVLKRAFHISTKLYPNNFFYMKKSEGKGLGVDGAPGEKGEIIFS